MENLADLMTPAPPKGTLPRHFVMKDEPGYIYFIHDLDLGFVKIGWTAHLKERIAALTKATDVRRQVLLVINGTHNQEQALHREFRPCRAMKREWFHRTPELEARMAALRVNPGHRDWLFV